jgi:HNH endonuclease
LNPVIREGHLLFPTGNIFSLKRCRYRTPDKNKRGYWRIRLKTKAKNYQWHRLIAEAFIPNDDPKNKTEVNHISGDKSDNSVGNLEWLTPEQNQEHAFEVGLATARKPVEAFRKGSSVVEWFPSMKEAIRRLYKFGVRNAHAYRALKHPHLTTGGFHFRRPETS